MDNVPLLTIAIPSYNRATYLDSCLSNLINQKKDIKNNIEILVSDNCSTDNTEEVVKKYLRVGNEINYIKNIENRGGEFNITQCFLLAKGQYILCFGDDDVLLVNSLKKIINLLQLNNDFGLITLFSEKKMVLENEKTYKIFDNKLDFLIYIKYYFTWISANIVNSKCINRENIFNYYGTCLNQVPIYLEAVANGKKNVAFISPLVLPGTLIKPSGYDFIQVFCINLNNIMDDFEKKYIDFKGYKIHLNKILLTYFWPNALLNAKLKSTKVSYNNAFIILFKYFKYYFYFWMYILPILILPYKLANWIYSKIK